MSLTVAPVLGVLSDLLANLLWRQPLGHSDVLPLAVSSESMAVRAGPSCADQLDSVQVKQGLASRYVFGSDEPARRKNQSSNASTPTMTQAATTLSGALSA